LKIDLRFAVRGRARFLSHLECVDVLVAACRRAGLEIALSHGLRPKPVISLALARAVGVESEDELATIELVDEHDPRDVAVQLAAALPRGIEVRSVARSAGTARAAASRFRVELTAPVETVRAAAGRYAELREAPVERRAPRRSKTVDVKASAPTVDVVDGGFEVEIAALDEGSARPEEVARVLATCAGLVLPVTRVIRLELRVARPIPVGAAHGEET